MQPGAAETAIVVFVVAGHPYAVPTATTREVLAWRSPRPLPGSDAWIEGVINLRGEIIPVCDLAASLGLGSRGPVTIETSIVIVEVDGECVGLTVDQVRSVMAITDDDVVEHAGVSHPAMAGIFQRDDELVVLLDTAQAIRGAESLGGLLTELTAAQDGDVDQTPMDIERNAA